MNLNKDLILRTFEDLPQIISYYFQNIPADCLDTRRTKEAWTIREHLYHIVSVQDMLYKRMLKICNEQYPIIEPYFPEDQKEQDKLYESKELAFAEYKKMRRVQIELIRTMEAAEFKKEARHAEYISYNIPIIINHMIFHEYWHMYRIEELWLTRDEYLK